MRERTLNLPLRGRLRDARKRLPRSLGTRMVARRVRPRRERTRPSAGARLRRLSEARSLPVERRGESVLGEAGRSGADVAPVELARGGVAPTDSSALALARWNAA